MWSKQYLLAKSSNSLDENRGPLSDSTVFGSPYSLNTCFSVDGGTGSHDAHFPNNWKPAVLIYYEDVLSRLEFKKVDPKLLPRSSRNFMRHQCFALLAPRKRAAHFAALGDLKYICCDTWLEHGFPGSHRHLFNAEMILIYCLEKFVAQFLRNDEPMFLEK